MNNKKIRCIIDFDADFSLEWDSDFEGSIATSKLLEGKIKMKYSSVPYFIYTLAKPLKDLDFLDGKIKNEILNCKKVSFADTQYEEIPECVQRDVEFYNSLLKEEINKEKLEILKESFDLLTLLKIPNLKRLDYVGRVPDSYEYPKPVHILSSLEKEIFIAQYWQGMNVLKIGEEETKEIIIDINKLYGVVVSGALRSLLEKR